MKPYYQGYDRIERTSEFIKWLDQKLLEAEPRSRFNFTEELEYKYDMGEHSRIIHIVNNLVQFDYDQVAEICDKEDRRNPDVRYYRPENGATYREMFGEGFFELLKYCQDEGWHFILFGFDS